MAQVGRISGPLLEANLERNGIDLVFRNDLDTVQLLYLDVNNNRIAVNRATPAVDLDINGTTRTVNLIGDTAPIANYTISTNNIDVSTGNIFLNASEAIVLSNLETTDFYASDNIISSKNNANIELRPNGAGTLEIFNDLRVNGNLHSESNITLGGTITFGDTLSQDTITFNTDIKSDIDPTTTDTYNLGSISKRWDELYTNLVNGQEITSGGANIGGVDLAKRAEYVLYVASNGIDTNTGDHIQGPLATIQEAISRVPLNNTEPYTIHIFPGVYEEQLPLIVPPGVTVTGHDLRNTIVKPAIGYEDKDVFHLNGQSTIQNLTVKDFQYDSVNNTGYAFRFASNAVISTRSPYIQNVTVKTQDSSSVGEITVGPDITLFSQTSNSVNLNKETWSQALVESLVGQTAVIDIYPNPPLYYTVVSVETDPGIPTQWRMTFDTTFNPAGQIKNISFYPDVPLTQIVTNDIWDTTGSSVGEKWVAWFKYNLPVNFETIVQPGWTINVAGTIYVVDYIIQDPVNANQWRIYVTTSLVGGVGIPIFSSPITISGLPAGKGAWIDGSEISPSSIEASMLFHSVTMITPGVDAVSMTNGVRVEWLNSFTYFANRGLYAFNGLTGRTSQDGSTIIYGAEIRSIGSANVYGTYGAVADGDDTLMYLIGHNFAYIGLNEDSSNDNTLAIQSQETVELNSGRIYYSSTDHTGTFRVGDNFFVDFERGTTSVDISTLTTNSLSGLVVNTGEDTTFVTGTNIETGNIRLSGNNAESLIGDLILVSATNEINLNDSTNISNNLYVSGDLNFGGTLNLAGNELTDSLRFNVDLEQDFNPNQHLKFSLGSPSKQWLVAYLNRLEVGDISIYDNVIETNLTNADLELRANGTGKIYVPDSATFSNALTVNGNTTLNNTIINGDVDFTGNLIQDGDTDISGNTVIDSNLSVTTDAQFEEILISENIITTTSSNADLELRATGTVNIQTSLEVTNNFYVNDVTAQSDVTATLTLTSDNTSFGNIEVNDNYIQVETLDQNLILESLQNVIISDSANFAQSLTVSGFTDVQNLIVNGTITHSGDKDQTGNYTLLGELFVDQIKVEDNFITTTAIDQNLTLSADGIGKVIVPINNVEISNNLTVQGLTTLENTSITGLVTHTGNRIQQGNYDLAGELTIANVYIEDNFISSINETNLILEAGSTGKILISESAQFNNDLTVNGISNFKDLNIDGTITRTGNTIHTGNYYQTGDTDITGEIFVDSTAQFTDIKIEGNTLYTTIGNNDLVLLADGNGTVNVTTSLIVNNNLSTNSIVVLGDINIDQDLALDQISIPPSIIDINDNYITTKDTNTNLELKASGTGTILVNFNNVEITNDLTVSQQTNLQDLTVTGVLTHTDNKTQLGDYTQTGNLEVDGAVTISSTATLENIQIDQNAINAQTGDLVLGASGTGVVQFSNLRASQNISADTVTAGNITINNGLALELLESSSDIQIFDNVITTTNSNSNLELRTNGTGSIILKQLRFNSNSLSTATTPITISANSVLDITATGALRVPRGTSANYPSLQIGDLRFNTSDGLFEGFNGGRVSFNGIYSSDRRTSVLAHPTNNTLLFTVNQTQLGLIDSDKFSIHRIRADDLDINNNVISTLYTNSDLELRRDGTGEVVIGNLSLTDNFIKNNSTPIVLTATGFGYSKLETTVGAVFPTGTVAERPAPETPPQIGDTRFNTEDEVLEVWDGSTYIIAAGTSSTISASEFNDLLLEYTIILG